LAGVTLSLPLTPKISLTYGLAFTHERVQQEGVSRDYALLQAPVTLAYDTANNLLEPVHGVKASVTLTPSLPTVGEGKAFLIVYASAATYIPVEYGGRGIVALRGQVGSIQGASVFQLPPDQRFYAGGSGTVRGYTYQTIGPLFPDDKPQGGLAMDAATLEFRQRIGANFGVVPFVDVGQVNTTSRPFGGITPASGRSGWMWGFRSRGLRAAVRLRCMLASARIFDAPVPYLPGRADYGFAAHAACRGGACYCPEHWRGESVCGAGN
jgi:translocation and assembly module TamA